MKKLPLSIPPGSDRIIGFTIPEAGVFYICDHDAVWRVMIGDPPSVELADNAAYLFLEGRIDFLGLVFTGQTANEPLMRVGPHVMAYEFIPTNDCVAVDYEIAGKRGQIRFPILSGDWFAASFSEDGRHLVLAEPYEIALYEVE